MAIGDDSVSDNTLFTSFNRTAQVAVKGHSGVELDNRTSLDAEITQSDPDSMQITAVGSYSINHFAPKAADREDLSSSTSLLFELVQLCDDKPFSFSASASGQFAGAASVDSVLMDVNLSSVAATYLDLELGIGAFSTPVNPVGSTSSTLSFPEGGCIGVTISLDAKHNSPQTSDPVKASQNPPVTSGSFTVTITLGPEPPPGTVFPWTGKSSDAFGNQANWKPDNGIPEFLTGSRSDTASFQDLGTLSVDLSAAAERRPPPSNAIGLCAGVINQSAGQMIVNNVASLEPINGTLALDSISFDQPSLMITNGGLLDLDKAAVCAQNAVIGSGVKASGIAVRDSGFLQTLGRLSVGQLGLGALGVGNGGVMQSEEVRLGDGTAKGSANVANATWNTGDIVVGYQSTGELTITNTGLMNSETAAVAFDLPPGPDPGISAGSTPCLGRPGNAGGVELTGTNSTWNTQNFSVGPLGCVDVTNQAVLNNTAQPSQSLALNDMTLGGGNAGNARLLVDNGGTVKTETLEVGDQGSAKLDLEARGGSQIQVNSIVNIGSSSSPSAVAKVTVTGDPAVTTNALTVDSLKVGSANGAAGLTLEMGAKISSNSAEVGTGSGVGAVGLDGTGGSTTWRIANPLTVGTHGFVAINNSTIDVVGTGGSPGTVSNQGLISGGTNALIALHHGLLTNTGEIIGPITIDGNYDASSTGSFVGQISGLTKVSGKPAREVVASKGPPPPAQGPVVITGDADLSNSQVMLQFVNGFAPKKGDVIPGVQIQGTQSGTIGSIVTSGLAPGATFTIDPVSGNATAQNDTVAEPVVTIKGPTTIKESQTKGVKVQVSRKGDTSTAITVNYQASGTATNGIDYATLPGTVVIPAKKTSATFLILPYLDGVFEPTETIELKLLSGDGYSVGLTSDIVIALQNVDPKLKKPKTN
ncbi:MAG TPA: Calx-beta domain-containing protein [Candidatus Binataceae bacterium]|nr:Calx-beta domain-containing protein [Candidatus Binataceae bacterium]